MRKVRPYLGQWDQRCDYPQLQPQARPSGQESVNANISIKDDGQLTALDVVKRFHSPLFRLTRSHTLTQFSDRGQQSQGHIPAKFVPLLEQVQFIMDDFDFGDSFHVDDSENRRFFRGLFSTTSRDTREDLWWDMTLRDTYCGLGHQDKRDKMI
ncbi:hypothetical protein CcaCcLH18_14385 [Colletotrichum camelliae]|nr:hypothetical protein CcaCcLH18_14385 [Colletotrichum camelliae]